MESAHAFITGLHGGVVLAEFQLTSPVRLLQRLKGNVPSCPKVNGVGFPFLSFLSLTMGFSSLTVSSSAGPLRNITLKAWPNSWPSYDAGVARFLTSRGYNVVEVNRPDRSTRYRKGKSDPTDAEMAARAVLAGVADATPKSGEGEVEMIRMLKSAKDSAVKARTQAINQMKALVVTAPAELRETLDGLAAGALVTRCKSFRTGRLDGPLAAARYTLRSLARRYRQLSKEVRDLEAELDSTHPDGRASPGRYLRHRTRHGGDPPHCRRE